MDDEDLISLQLSMDGLRSALEKCSKFVADGQWASATEAVKAAIEQLEGYAYGEPNKQKFSFHDLNAAIIAKDATKAQAAIKALIQQIDEAYPAPRTSQARFAGELVRNGEQIELVLMTPGQANGYDFPASVLEAGYGVFANCTSFVNHELPQIMAALPGGRKIQDVCGVVSQPRWDRTRQAILGNWRPSLPAGPWVNALIRQIMADRNANLPVPNIGVSTDVSFKHKQGQVIELVTGHSADIVFQPARGPQAGEAFVRVVNAVAQRSTMSEQPASTVLEQLERDRKAVVQLLDVQTEREKLQKEAEEARKVRLSMCQYLLDSGLGASRLPQPAQDRIRGQFANKIFEPGELTTAIDDMRKMISELTGSATVAGLSGARQMFSSADQIQAAVDDLFEVKREAGAEKLKVHRLSGIRELYHGLTGDLDFHGGVFPERAQFQHTTANFTGLVKNAMNKVLIDRWNELGKAGYNWWEKIVHSEHFETLNQITWLIFGTVGSLPSVAEGAEYTELKIGDSPETSNFTKYGGYIGLTMETLDRDDTRKLRAIPRELATAALRNISSLVAAIFTANSGIGPTLADTGALFNNTAVTTAGGHANLLTTALGTDLTAWRAVSKAIYNQPMLIANETGYIGTGKKMAIKPKFCLVPADLEGAAADLFLKDWNASGPVIEYAQVIPITVPDWTDATDWAAVCDPKIVPGICVGERFGLQPEIFVAGDELSPAVFMNDESRLKVRHFIAVGVADFRPLHKENVSG